MVWRIIVQAGIFRISKPGIDVFAAGPQDLLFDANNLAFGPTWFTGTVVPLGTDAYPNGATNRSVVLQYPFALPFTPYVMAQTYEPGGSPSYSCGGMVTVQDNPGVNRGVIVDMAPSYARVTSFHMVNPSTSAPLRYVIIMTPTT